MAQSLPSEAGYQVSVHELVADPTCLESCDFVVNDSPAIEIGDTDKAEVSDAWVTNPLYIYGTGSAFILW